MNDPERPRTGVLLIPAGARSDEMENEGYLAALETAWIRGTFGYFDFTRRTMEVLNGAKGSEERRAALLDRAYRIGLSIDAPDDAAGHHGG